MRVFLKIILVCVCAVLVALQEGGCDDVEVSGSVEDGGENIGGRVEDHVDGKKDGKTSALPGSVRRASTLSNANTTREHLLSVLRERRKQMFNGRLAAHINTIASFASRPRNSTAFAQLEIRDPKNSIVRRITLDNSSNLLSPTIKVTTTNGSKETQQEFKPQEIKQLFPNLSLFQENKSRAGFLNNRRKQVTDYKPETLFEKSSESGIIYIPPEGYQDKEVILEPDEEFQVDESNHGLYLLNYSDVDNVTSNPQKTNTIITTDSGLNTTVFNDTVSLKINVSNSNITKEEDMKLSETSTTATDISTKVTKIENDTEKENKTLFMSDELYNHLRPLESEIPAEDMAPFKSFGQKINGPLISDNLTNSPSVSASTKSINFIVPSPDKRRYNSRYSATEKYRNTSANEEEINEDMDVSVVKNTIEKNKVRNTVKGVAPAKPVGIVSAYKRYSTTTVAPAFPIIQSISQISNSTTDFTQNNPPINSSEKLNDTNSIHSSNSRINGTTSIKDMFLNKVNTTARNYTRNFSRRRPQRLSSTTENILPIPTGINATTEKASTSVYTAVVTSVSITSSMKGQNKTDGDSEDLSNNFDTKENTTSTDLINNNHTETITPAPSTSRYHKHIIRIRTTTTESSVIANITPASLLSFNQSLSPDDSFTKLDSKSESVSKYSEKLVNQTFTENPVSSSTARPRKRKKRPTTTTTSTTILPTFTTKEKTIDITTASLSSLTLPVTTIQTLEASNSPGNTLTLDDLTTSTVLESSSEPPISKKYSPESELNIKISNNTKEEEDSSQNEEVVIEVDKNYTTFYVLAGLGFLPVAAIIAFILKNILNKKTKEIDTEYEGYFEDGDIKKESPITPVARPPLPTPSKPDQKWEFPRNKLRLQTLLGQGNFGQVWKAEADDLNGHDGLTRLVAVKSIKETASQKEKQELLHEIYIMQKIGTHPNVVTLLACCTEQEPYLLIMEYVMCGKLLTYLRERRSRPDRFSGSGAVTSRDLTVFAYCVARGMDYIASKGIVHRDLAARNVLVDHNKLCKIADFGMSRAAGGATRGRHALPVRWMAPEALLYNVYSHQTDVWAFGILLWEIVTLGSTPYAAMSGREVLAAVTEGYRLERPPHCKPQLYRAMHACWHADPSQRPTFAVLKSQLADLLDNEPSEGNYVDLDSFYQESSVYSDPSAIIHDEDGLSAEYDRETRVFRELAKGPAKFDNRAFSLRDEELRNKFGIGTPRMGGFGIKNVTNNFERNFSDGEFNERSFTDKNFTDRNFGDKNFTDRNFTDKSFTDKNFNDPEFTERKDGKLSTSSFHRERERERENPLVSRNSFNGFPRIGTRDNHFQMSPDGRNKRVPEFECDI